MGSASNGIFWRTNSLESVTRTTVMSIMKEPNVRLEISESKSGFLIMVGQLPNLVNLPTSSTVRDQRSGFLQIRIRSATFCPQPNYRWKTLSAQLTKVDNANLPSTPTISLRESDLSTEDRSIAIMAVGK